MYFFFLYYPLPPPSISKLNFSQKQISAFLLPPYPVFLQFVSGKLIGEKSKLCLTHTYVRGKICLFLNKLEDSFFLIFLSFSFIVFANIFLHDCYAYSFLFAPRGKYTPLQNIFCDDFGHGSSTHLNKKHRTFHNSLPLPEPRAH